MVTWFEMGKQELKMTAQVCASNGIIDETASSIAETFIAIGKSVL